MRNLLRLGSLSLAACLALPFAACGGGSTSGSGGETTPTAKDERTLYERLGGADAVAAVVKQFVANCAADERINSFFANTDVARLEQMLAEQICEASGGGCTYSGKTMREVHTGMQLTDDHFNALVEDLVAALDQFQVPAKEKDELLGLLAPMKGDIVGL